MKGEFTSEQISGGSTFSCLVYPSGDVTVIVKGNPELKTFV